ncbi:hypothetical protein ACQPZJ_35650 [Actinoplanes sp. CA-054009]
MQLTMHKDHLEALFYGMDIGHLLDYWPDHYMNGVFVDARIAEFLEKEFDA